MIFLIKKGSLLATAFSFNILNFAWLNIKTIEYNQIMHRIENSAGEGITTIGKLKKLNKVESDLVKKKLLSLLKEN